jgi:glycosyltransferase involved in cell wall biosynthesis
MINSRTILHLCDSLSVGGAERLILGLAGQIDRARFALQVCSLGSLRGNLLQPELERTGVPVALVGSRRFYDPAALAAVARLVRAQGVELIHTHLTYADVVGRLVGRLAGVPVVSTLHNEPTDYNRQRRDRRLLQRLTARRAAAHLIAVSPRLRELFVAEWGLPPGRVTAIMNAVPLERYLAVPERPAPAPGEPLTITTIGRLSPQKDHATLLAAARPLLQRRPELRLQLVGQGRLEAPLRAQAEALGIAGQVIFAGVRHDIPAVLAASDIFVLASRWEGVPITAAEAMAAGRAVLLTDVGGCRDLLAHEREGLLVPPGDAAALGAALARLADDAGLRQRLGAAARERARRELDMATFVARHEALYERVLDGAPGTIGRRVAAQK